MSNAQPPTSAGFPAELPGADEEAFRLICAVCDGYAAPSDLQRLEALLETEAGMSLYVAVADLDAALRWRLRWRNGRRPLASLRASRPGRAPAVDRAVRSDEPRVPAGSSEMRRRLTGWLEMLRRPTVLAVVAQSLVVFVAIVAAVVGQWRVAPDAGPRFDPAAFGGAAARITGLHDVGWGEGATSRRISDLLLEGERIDLAHGLVEIVHACGAKVVIEGPAVFTVAGRAAATLDRGRLTAKLPKAGADRRRSGAAPRFAVQTPKAVITDLGTEFGVEVGDDGAAIVYVFEGLVDFAAAGAAAVGTLRVAAGESAELAAGGRAVRTRRPPPRLARSLPKTAGAAAAAPRGTPGIFWDDAAARVIYRDSFSGDGPLAGTKPASRGGVGDVAWSAPAAGWTCGSALVASTAGGAFLPLTVEPGCIYRVSVDMHVTAGGIGWAAVGCADAPSATVGLLSHAWLMQRHDPAKQPNQYFAGPRQAGGVGRGDSLTGPHTRAVVLDTTGPTWKAFFLVDGAVVASHGYGAEPPPIARVGIGLFANTEATLRNFRVSVIRRGGATQRP